jgi:hypothetical protein
MEDPIIQNRRKLRTLAGSVEKALLPLAAQDIESCSVIWYDIIVRGLFYVFVILPITLAVFLIYVPLIPLDYCLEKYFFHRSIFLQDGIRVLDDLVTNVLAFIGYPKRTFHMLRSAQTFKRAAISLMPNQATSVYLIPIEVLQTWTTFPVHEEASSQLKQKRISDLWYEEVLFVSHKWFDNKPDTPNNDILTQVKDIKFDDRGHRYVWFDFTCIPQSPEREMERRQQLFAIASLMKKCLVEAFYVNDLHQEAYQTSVWCRLEMMVTSVPEPIQMPVQNWDTFSVNNLTILDINDLYEVLPSFIELVFSTRFVARFVLNYDRAVLFVTILRHFIKYHDQTYGSEIVGAIV